VSPLRARDGDVVLCMNETELRLEKEDVMVTFAEGRRKVRHFIESHPELFNGSVEVDGVTDPNLAEYLFLMAAVRDACHAAARDVAARFNLDFRKREDYSEAYRILAEEDPSWSAASFDQLSASAQDRVIFAARRAMRTHANGGHYGRPAARGQHVMLDQYATERHNRMLAIAKRDNLDLSTVDGRTVAYQRSCDESPHLKIPQGRGRANAADMRHLGVMPVAGKPFDDQFAQYKLRRGQGPVGNPVGAPDDFSETEHHKPSGPPPAEGTSGTGGIGGRLY
jgi:hypothetical protein